VTSGALDLMAPTPHLVSSTTDSGPPPLTTQEFAFPSALRPVSDPSRCATDSGNPRPVSNHSECDAGSFGSGTVRAPEDNSAAATRVIECQYLYFVRHAESRWNEAQRCGILQGAYGMFRESNHGLSQEGRRQAEDLHHRILMARLDWEAGVMPQLEVEWMSRFFNPNVVFSSPLTRAVETAFIALREVLAETGQLVLLKATREQRSSYLANDNAGGAVGRAIAAHIQEDTRQLYEGVDEELGEVVLDSLCRTQLDVTDVEEEWWSTAIDTATDMRARINVFLGRLRSVGNGASCVVVGHSYFFLRVFREYLNERAKRKRPKMAAYVREHLLPYCAVVGVKLEWSADGEASISSIVPLLGTTLIDPADGQANTYSPMQTLLSCTGHNRKCY